jgi:hypothetical protein
MSYLLRQPMFDGHLHYAPTRQFADGGRQYSEMHTADWWWNTQVQTSSAFVLDVIELLSDVSRPENPAGWRYSRSNHPHVGCHPPYKLFW